MKGNILVNLLTSSSAPIRVCLINSKHPTLKIVAHGLLNDQELHQKVLELIVPLEPDTKKLILAKKYVVPFYNSVESACGFVILSIKATVSGYTKSSATSKPLQLAEELNRVECSNSRGFSITLSISLVSPTRGRK